MPQTTKPSKKDLNNPEISQNLDSGLQELLKAVQPLLEFQKASEENSQDDIRIYWDVRLVRGKDTLFAHVKGASSNPGMLANNMIAKAPCRIQEECQDKIFAPLLAKMQQEAERVVFDRVEKSKTEEGFISQGDPDQ